MNKKTSFLIACLILLLVITGIAVYKVMTFSNGEAVVEEDTIDISILEADASIVVNLEKSTSKSNTVLVNIEGLAGKVVSIAYELTYDSGGLIKGVNSGSKPILTDGKDTFSREVYMGTCSKNVCKPDLGVTSVSLVLQFTHPDGKKSQFSKEYDL